MEPQSVPSTSSTAPQNCNILETSINGVESTRLIKRIIQKCHDDKIRSPDEHYLKRAECYTGLHQNILKELEDLKVILVVVDDNVDRSVIQNALIKFYFENKMPTTKELFDAVIGQVPKYMDIRSFRKLLYRMDYAWKKVGCRYVVVENPSAVVDRFNYLHALKQFREQERPIFFVGQCTFDIHGKPIEDSKGDAVTNLLFAVSRSAIHGFIYTSDLDDETGKKWYAEVLQPLLPAESVIVLDNSSLRELIHVPPTAFSLRSEMIDWLQFHSVPFDPDMLKFELFDLIMKLTDVRSIYKLDNELELLGHRVLRIPKCISDLTPVTLVVQLVARNLMEYVSKSSDRCIFKNDPEIKTIFSLITEEHISNFNNYIKNEEARIYAEDCKLDQIFDDILKKTETTITEEYIDSDIPSSSDNE